jgi:hypothetical protein
MMNKMIENSIGKPYLLINGLVGTTAYRQSLN